MVKQYCRRGIISAIILSLFFAVAATPAYSESPVRGRDILSPTARLVPSTIRTGEIHRLEFHVTLKKDWYIYSVIPSIDEDAPPPTTLTIDSDDFELDGPVYESRPKSKRVDVLELDITYHPLKASFFQNLKVKSTLTPGNYTLRASLRFQGCTDEICLPADTVTVEAPFALEAGEARDEYLIADRAIDAPVKWKEKTSLNQLTGEGIWAFIALAALMGLFSLLTPCVFPMIPITVSFFSKQSEGSQSRVVKLAVIFMGGIIFTYTAVGLAVSALFGAGSALRLASNPVVNLVIAIVFIIFAFSLIGIFTIKLPPSIENYFDNKARQIGGVAGVLLMGFTFTLTAFTCTVQFVGTMLIAAAHGEWVWPVIGMLVFSTVFSFPFFLLAIAPGLINRARGKSGAWMGRAKVVLGILELMASVKFLSNADLVWQTNLISRNTAIAVWIVLLLTIVCYLTWTAIRPKLNRSPVQWAIIGLFILGLIGLTRGWDGKSLGGLIDAVLPPVSVAETAVSGSKENDAIDWVDSYEIALEKSAASNKKIFLEFTGYTCVNCRWMEQNILSDHDIERILSDRYIPARLYTDGGKNATENLQLQIDKFQTVALPFYAIISTDGTIVASISGVIRDKNEFIRFLKQGI